MKWPAPGRSAPSEIPAGLFSITESHQDRAYKLLPQGTELSTWSIGSFCCIRAIQRTRLASRPLRSYTAIQRSTLYSFTSLYTIQPMQHPSEGCTRSVCWGDARGARACRSGLDDPGDNGLPSSLLGKPRVLADRTQTSRAGRGLSSAGGVGAHAPAPTRACTVEFPEPHRVVADASWSL